MTIKRWLVGAVLLGVLAGGAELVAQGQRGEKAVRAGDYEKAIAVFQVAVRSKNKYWGFNMFLLGYSYYQNKQWQEAVAAFDELFLNAGKQDLRSYGFEPAWHFWRGLAYDKNGQHKQAVDSLTIAADLAPAAIPADFWPTWKLRSLQPTKETCYNRLSLVQYSNGAYQEAVATVKKGIELSPEKGNWYSALAQAHTGLKQFDEAMAAARRGLELEPDWFAYGVLGDLYAAQKQYDEAVEAYRMSIEKGPRIDAPRSLLGQALLSIGDDKGAVQAFEEAAGLAPEDPRHLYWLMTAHAQGGRFDDAVEVCDRAVAMLTSIGTGSDAAVTRKRIIPKEAARFYGSRSLYARELGRRNDAAKDAELAYRLDPDAENVRMALAAVKLDAGDAAAAASLLSAVKDRPLARILEATAHARKGDFKQARAIYVNTPAEELAGDRTMRQNARNAFLGSVQSHIRESLEKAGELESAGRALEAMVEYAGAIKLADEAAARSIWQRVAGLLKANPHLAELPEEARKHGLRGDLLIKDGRFDEALKEYRAAVALAPFNARLHFNAALVCAELKDFRGAIDHMTSYLQLAPDAPNARSAKDEIYKWEFSLENTKKDQ